VQVILLDVLMVDGLVERDDASGRVADEEDEDDGAQHQRLPVFVRRMLRVRRGGNRTWKSQLKKKRNDNCKPKHFTASSKFVLSCLVLGLSKLINPSYINIKLRVLAEF
jgi:hypothetical protein